MVKKQITIEGLLWLHSQNKDGLHPVKVKVTFNRKTKYYPVQVDGKNLYLSEAQWQNIQEKQVRKESKRLKEIIEDAKAKARDSFGTITSNKRPFTFDRFEKEFLLDTSAKGFIKFFEEFLSGLLSENRVGTYHTYHCALQAFKEFRNGHDLDPIDLNPDLLKDFESFLKKEKRSVTARGKVTVRKAGKTTISIYMRALRAVYNFISGRQPFLKEHYPFATRTSERTKYQIKSGSGSKGEALSIEQLKRFVGIEVIPNSPEWRAKLIWLFSFYCNGMNFNDIARLSRSDIRKDSIVYVRQKTKETEGREEMIEIPINETIRKIISDLSTSDKRPNSYVFDYLPKGLTPMQQSKVVGYKLKIVNKWLRKLCIANDLPPITTYWARHTYASILKHSGTPVELIRELLGHSDIKTTESYLTRFDLDKKKQANENVRLLLNLN